MSEEVSVRKSHIIATAVLTLGAAMLPSTAFAEPPQNLTSRFTDLANVVADDGAVAAELDKIPGDDFWIVTVNDLDGKEAQAWAEQTHKRSGMDRHDGLVVISVGTSEVGWHSTAKDPGVSEATLNKALNPQVMALFGEHKWDEAVIALARNVNAIARGGDAVVGEPARLPWVLIGVGVAAAGGAVAIYVSKRRKKKAEIASADRQVQEASAALLAIDDDVRTATAELEFARAEFGLEATQSFQQTLETARAAVQSAFQIHARLQDADPETPTQKLDMGAQISELVGSAREALAHHTKQFSELRNLAASADTAVADMKTRVSELAHRLDLGKKTVDNLHASYPASALETLHTYPAQISQLLDATVDSLQSADAALTAGDRNGAVPYVRLAAGTLDQASQLTELLLNAPAELAKETEQVRLGVESLSSDIADARRLAPNDPGLAPLLSAAVEAVERASSGNADPFRMSEELRETETQIDLALAPFREAEQTRRKMEANLQHTLALAQRAIHDADATITRYRSSTRSGAREQLALAQEYYLRATQSDTSNAITLAESARQLAMRAKQAAYQDAERANRGGAYGSGGYSFGNSSYDDSFAGALVGSILGGIARGIISDGFGGSGGFSGSGRGGGSGPSGSDGPTGGRRGF